MTAADVNAIVDKLSSALVKLGGSAGEMWHMLATGFLHRISVS